MDYEIKNTSAPGRKEVKVLGATYEEGSPKGEETGRWRLKLKNRDQQLKYLQTAERYWYSKEWFGSERRKNPA
jgi:hypothetical protein